MTRSSQSVRYVEFSARGRCVDVSAYLDEMARAEFSEKWSRLTGRIERAQRNFDAAPVVASPGRPTRVARDAAIFIARHWRVRFLRETIKTADEWIVEHWKDMRASTGGPAASGISDPAHVRAAVARARQTWLGNCYLLFNDALALKAGKFEVLDGEGPSYESWLPPALLPTGFEMDACAIAAIEVYASEPRAWLWQKGRAEAQSPARIEFYEDVPSENQNLRPTVKAAAKLVGFTERSVHGRELIRRYVR